MATKNMKRIHKVVIKQMYDESPDTSWLGDYAEREEESGYSIDRAHDLDCLCQPYNRITGEGARILDSAQAYLMARMDESYSDEDLRVWYDDGDTFISSVLAGDAEEFCLGSCVSHWSNREYRYFNPNHENYAGLPEDEIRKYCLQDYARMESLNNQEFCFIGIRAEAEIQLAATWENSVVSKASWHCPIAPYQTITSGGLWGIESDSSPEYIKEVEAEELSSLKAELKAIGFSSRAIATAFKNVERKEI